MNQKTNGAVLGLAAFAAWGLLPAYWKQLQAVNPFEILCHRIIWSCVFLTGIIAVQKRGQELKDIVKTPGVFRSLVFSGLIIGFNWFIYIWAVNSDRVVETSLGYYMNPMFNVLLGCVLLGERFSRLQWVAVLFAACGVGYSLLAYGTLPLFAIALAVSFGLYGYARKKINAAPIPGLFIETLVLFLPAAAYVLHQYLTAGSPFLRDAGVTLWCMGSGVVTSLPLLWFAAAAKRLNLSTIGILQYLAPSIAFVLGVFVYQEPFTRHSLITFSLIWIGVLLYIRESLAVSGQ